MYVFNAKELKNALVAFMCTWGLQLLFGMTVRNPLTLIFFAVFFLMGEKAGGGHSKRAFLVMALISVLLSAAITFLCGKKAVSAFDSALFKLMGMVIIFAGVSLVAFRVILFLISLVHGKNDLGNAAVKGDIFSELRPGEEEEKECGFTLKDCGLMLFFALICFLCWFPYFLYEYPGIMTADSIVQYEQIIGANPMSNHHPVIHTLTIGFFYNIGMKFTGNVNRAISFYTIVQMVFLALCCGRTVVQVKRTLKGGKWFILSLVFFALVPFNAVFAVTIWKDVPFAGFVMLMGCRLCEMIRKEKAGLCDYVLLMILSVFLSLFRSNGWYAFLLCAPFMVWAFRRDMVKVLMAVGGAVLITAIVKGPVMNGAGIIQPDFTESLSLPIQQVARVLVEDKDIPAQDMEKIEAVIDTTYIHELYATDFADNMKELVRAGHPEVIENNKGEYLGLWIRTGLKYPVQYLKAWFDLEGGYVYPDIPYEVGNIDGIMGNDYGLIPTPLIGGKAVVKGKEILIKLGSFVPLYGMLWCAGAFTWMVCFALFVVIKKDRGYLPFVILQTALILTLLIAAPVVDFRYEYGITMLMPLTVAICVMIIKKRGLLHR